VNAKKVITEAEFAAFLDRCNEAAARVKYYKLGPDHEVVEATRDEWTAMFMDAPGRTVAKTMVDGALVSTVFLGLDHRFIGDGPPIVFESMTFANGEPGIEIDTDRYVLWSEALAGHEAMVRRVRNKVVAFGKRK